MFSSKHTCMGYKHVSCFNLTVLLSPFHAVSSCLLELPLPLELKPVLVHTAPCLCHLQKSSMFLCWCMLPQGFMQPHTKPCQGINADETLTSRKAVSPFIQHCWIMSPSGTGITIGSALKLQLQEFYSALKYQQLML